MDPGSRLFVALAEEYRKLGRVRDALGALQKGLLAHPGYIAAQVAMGRAYVEADQIVDAIATFARVLAADPANLVAAKSLAEIYLARGDSLEALKKYKLYRAISGDRKVDEMIARLEPQVAPKPILPLKAVITNETPLPPPPSFQDVDRSRRPSRPSRSGRSALRPVDLSDPFDITSVAFEPGEDSGQGRRPEELLGTPTRDAVIAPEPPPVSEAVTRIIPAAELLSMPSGPTPPFEPPAEPELLSTPSPGEGGAEPGKPTGRGLADLYYAQGHYAEALQIYDDLVSRHPFDEDLKRMRRDSEARLLPAGAMPSGAAPDPGLDRRIARIRVLKRWLSQVQTG